MEDLCNKAAKLEIYPLKIERAGVFKGRFWPHLQNCPFYPFMVVLNVSYAENVFLMVTIVREVSGLTFSDNAFWHNVK